MNFNTIRALMTFLVVVAAIYLIGSLLAYPIAQILEHVVHARFHKVIHYTTLLCGLLFGAFYLKLNDQLTRAGFGYAVSGNTFVANMLSGFFQGMLVFALLQIVFLMLGIYRLNEHLGFNTMFVLGVMAKALTIGCLVAWIEETIFRGALLSGLTHHCHILLAILVSSAFFSAAHFMKYPVLAGDEPIQALSGLKMLSAGMVGIFHTDNIDPFITVFLLGILLCLIRVKEQHIARCIGFHAGLVAALKMAREYTIYTPNTPYDYLVSQHNHTFGILASIWFLVLIAWIYFKYLIKTR